MRFLYLLNKSFVLLRGIPKTILINFYYFSFKTAIKFPIWCSPRVHIKSLSGEVVLNTQNISSGMIQLGFHAIDVYDRKERSMWNIVSGVVIIEGNLYLHSGFGISVLNNGVLKFGSDIHATSRMKIICYDSIVIGEHCRIAWETIITDTNFHYLINRISGLKSQLTKPVIIGKNNWIGIRTVILAGTRTPDFCTVGANSLLNKYYDFPTDSIIAGNPCMLKRTGWYRDIYSNLR